MKTLPGSWMAEPLEGFPGMEQGESWSRAWEQVAHKAGEPSEGTRCSVLHSLAPITLRNSGEDPLVPQKSRTSFSLEQPVPILPSLQQQ